MQTLKIGESSYIILFLTQIFSKCLYWEVQHWMSQKSQYVMEIITGDVHSSCEVNHY